MDTVGFHLFLPLSRRYSAFKKQELLITSALGRHDGQESTPTRSALKQASELQHQYNYAMDKLIAEHNAQHEVLVVQHNHQPQQQQQNKTSIKLEPTSSAPKASQQQASQNFAIDEYDPYDQTSWEAYDLNNSSVLDNSTDINHSTQQSTSNQKVSTGGSSHHPHQQQPRSTRFRSFTFGSVNEHQHHQQAGNFTTPVTRPTPPSSSSTLQYTPTSTAQLTSITPSPVHSTTASSSTLSSPGSMKADKSSNNQMLFDSTTSHYHDSEEEDMYPTTPRHKHTHRQALLHDNPTKSNHIASAHSSGDQMVTSSTSSNHDVLPLVDVYTPQHPHPPSPQHMISLLKSPPPPGMSSLISSTVLEHPHSTPHPITGKLRPKRIIIRSPHNDQRHQQGLSVGLRRLHRRPVNSWSQSSSSLLMASISTSSLLTSSTSTSHLSMSSPDSSAPTTPVPTNRVLSMTPSATPHTIPANTIEMPTTVTSTVSPESSLSSSSPHHSQNHQIPSLLVIPPGMSIPFPSLSRSSSRSNSLNRSTSDQHDHLPSPSPLPTPYSTPSWAALRNPPEIPPSLTPNPSTAHMPTLSHRHLSTPSQARYEMVNNTPSLVLTLAGVRSHSVTPSLIKHLKHDHINDSIINGGDDEHNASGTTAIQPAPTSSTPHDIKLNLFKTHFTHHPIPQQQTTPYTQIQDSMSPQIPSSGLDIASNKSSLTPTPSQAPPTVNSRIVLMIDPVTKKTKRVRVTALPHPSLTTHSSSPSSTHPLTDDGLSKLFQSGLPIYQTSPPTTSPKMSSANPSSTTITSDQPRRYKLVRRRVNKKLCSQGSSTLHHTNSLKLLNASQSASDSTSVPLVPIELGDSKNTQLDGYSVNAINSTNYRLADHAYETLHTIESSVQSFIDNLSMPSSSNVPSSTVSSEVSSTSPPTTSTKGIEQPIPSMISVYALPSSPSSTSRSSSKSHIIMQPLPDNVDAYILPSPENDTDGDAVIASHSHMTAEKSTLPRVHQLLITSKLTPIIKMALSSFLPVQSPIPMDIYMKHPSLLTMMSLLLSRWCLLSGNHSSPQEVSTSTIPSNLTSSDNGTSELLPSQPSSPSSIPQPASLLLSQIYQGSLPSSFLPILVNTSHSADILPSMPQQPVQSSSAAGPTIVSTSDSSNLLVSTYTSQLTTLFILWWYYLLLQTSSRNPSKKPGVRQERHFAEHSISPGIFHTLANYQLRSLQAIERYLPSVESTSSKPSSPQ